MMELFIAAFCFIGLKSKNICVYKSLLINHLLDT